MAYMENDIKATVKKIIQGNEKRKRRVVKGMGSVFDKAATLVIEDALYSSCGDIMSDNAREELQKQIYKSIVYSMPYESIVGVICGRRQFYNYRTEFVTLVAVGLDMWPCGSSRVGHNRNTKQYTIGL